MSKVFKMAAAMIVSMGSAAAQAAWVQGNVTEIVVRAVGDGNDFITVKGTFDTGCPNNGFIVSAADQYFKETMALMVTAKMSGAPIKFDNVYCVTTGPANGLARGNGYSML